MHWVDIMHAPAEDFVQPGDLVLTTGADVRQPGVREFLTFLVSSPAAGVVLSPPRGVPVDGLLNSLIALADRHDFPVVYLAWEVPFSDVQRSLLPRLLTSQSGTHDYLAIGRREHDDPEWQKLANTFAEVIPDLALAAGLTVDSSVTDDLILSQFVAGLSATAVREVVDAAQERSGMPTELVSWALFPPQNERPVVTTSTTPTLRHVGTKGPRQFVEVLREHPRSMAAITQTLQPLIEYDETRRGQLVHTLEILLNKGTNTSAAARALFLNRHSLLYRIKLIEDLTGLSLKNPADRFHLEASIRVHQINTARNHRA